MMKEEITKQSSEALEVVEFVRVDWLLELGRKDTPENIQQMSLEEIEEELQAINEELKRLRNGGGDE